MYQWRNENWTWVSWNYFFSKHANCYSSPVTKGFNRSEKEPNGENGLTFGNDRFLEFLGWSVVFTERRLFIECCFQKRRRWKRIAVSSVHYSFSNDKWYGWNQTSRDVVLNFRIRAIFEIPKINKVACSKLCAISIVQGSETSCIPIWQCKTSVQSGSSFCHWHSQHIFLSV